jgi:queuosine biosynthesis protein QueC
MMQVPSYTADQLKEIQAKEYDTVAIFSGGMDSTTLVYHMLDKGWTPLLISFDYGQRHNKELFYARNTAIKLGLRHEIIDLTGITHLISNSALTSSPTGRLTEHRPNLQSVDPLIDRLREIIPVPEGHYAEETMKATVVPNRNMIMLSIAAGVAVNIGAQQGRHRLHGNQSLSPLRGHVVLLQGRGLPLRSLWHLRRAAGGHRSGRDSLQQGDRRQLHPVHAGPYHLQGRDLLDHRNQGQVGE